MITGLEATRFHESKSFVKPTAKIYPLRIPRQHYQLRHFISTSEDGVVYHTSSRDVYALYTATGKRERIASLEFTPVCFAAAFGWLCAGADDGRCVFIDVQDRSADVDSLLPLNLDPSARDDGATAAAYLYQSRAMRAKIHQRSIGNDIINSITLYRMKSEDRDIIVDEDVAVVSTNEKSIHIFSLQRLQPIKVLEFPVNMNHASISPDGSLLVACGDKEEAFFCRRKRVPGLIVDGEQTFAAYDWEEFAHIRLPKSELRDSCFSTAFSPSGHVCSIASQNGIVTIFDVSLLRRGMDDDEAVIDCFTSSRPAAVPDDMSNWMPGAVRSSAFSPGPWDFFAWAEDRGRVCIADMRDGFRTRQLLELDPKASNIQRCEITDVEDSGSMADLRALDLEASFLRRHRDALASQDHPALAASAADLIERSTERHRRSLNRTYEPPNDGLSALERELDQERLIDQRDDAAAENGNDRVPYVNHYGTTGPNQPSMQYLPQMSVGRYIRERSSTLSREAASSNASTRALPPRRRSSGVIASSSSRNEAQSETQTSSSRPSSLRLPLTMGSSSTLSASPSRLGATSAQSSARSSAQSSPAAPAGGSDARQDAWRTISEALTQASARDATSLAEAGQRSRLRELSRHERLLAEEHQALERRRTRQYELQGGAGGTAEQADADAEPQSGSPSSARRNAAQQDEDNDHDDEGGNDARPTPALPLSPAERRRQQSIVAQRMWRIRHGRQEQMLDRAERGLDAIRTDQLRRLQERARLAEDQLAAGVRGVNAGLGDLMREAEAMGGLGWARRDREERSEYGVAVMGLGWSGDGRSLFVGTEDGIFEFQVELGPRRCMPAIMPR